MLNMPDNHDGVIKWKHFPRYWSFVRGIHRSLVNSPHKGQWRGAFMFSLICAWINGWVNNGETGDLRRHGAHYDVIVMIPGYISCPITSHSIRNLNFRPTVTLPISLSFFCDGFSDHARLQLVAYIPSTLVVSCRHVNNNNDGQITINCAIFIGLRWIGTDSTFRLV